MKANRNDRSWKDIRRLAKRYRSIRLDIQPVIKQLENGEVPGDAIPHLNYRIFKLKST